MSRPRVANPFGLFPLAVLLAVALPSAATAGAIQRLTTNNASETGTDAAVDATGRIHVVYERDGNVYYRGRTGAAWSVEELVAAGTAPAVGAGPSGVPQVVFVSGSDVWFTARTGGTWTAPVSFGTGNNVDLAVDGNEVAHVVYLGDYHDDGYADIIYKDNGGGTFPAAPMKIWDSFSVPGTGRYYHESAPVIAADAGGHFAIGYRWHYWDSGGYWGSYDIVYRSATNDEVYSPELYRGYLPAPWKNGLALDDYGTAYLVYGTTLATVAGTTWTTRALPAGSSYALTLSPGALHVGYVNLTGGIEYSVDTGAGFGTPLVLDATTTARSPVVLWTTGPFVAYEAVDSGDYEVWFARTTNQAPVLDAIGDRSTNEGVNLSFTVSATDADGDDLVYSASNLPTGASFDPATRTFSWTPAFDQAGGYSAVVFSVSDGTATDSETITITVNDVNAPPVLAPIGDRSVNEAATLTFTISATDFEGNALTYSASNLPTGATFDPGTKTFSWTPGYDKAGSYPGVTFQVTDNGAPNRNDSEAITITVDNVNQAPVLAAIGDHTVIEGDTLSFTVSATDADAETLTYSASNLPTGATFTPATRTFSWTPGYDKAGSYPAVVFTVADAETTDSESITITVSDNPTPPGFFTVVPCRVLDTRWATGAYGGPALVAGADRTFNVVASSCSIPASATAVSVNLTVTEASTAGNLRLYPAGVPLPLVSTINYVPGVTRANNAIVSLSALGDLVVRCTQASGTVHFVLDVNGYFQEGGD